MNNNENKTKGYEKPSMRFVQLRSKKEVANTCWGYAANNTGGDLYYNSPGYGWVNFSVYGGKYNDSKKLYYTINGYRDGMTNEQQTKAASDLDSYWNTTAANGGSPFKGDSADYLENASLDTLTANWS